MIVSSPVQPDGSRPLCLVWSATVKEEVRLLLSFCAIRFTLAQTGLEEGGGGGEGGVCWGSSSPSVMPAILTDRLVVTSVGFRSRLLIQVSLCHTLLLPWTRLGGGGGGRDWLDRQRRGRGDVLKGVGRKEEENERGMV